MERSDIANVSLKGLKAFVKVCKAKSPKVKMLKEDLKKVIKVLDSKNSREILECDKYITERYPMTFSESFKYNLRYMREDEFIALNIEEQIMSLHQLAHFLEDSLKKETIDTKLTTAGKEIIEGMLVYGFEKATGDKEDMEKATRKGYPTTG